MLSKVYKSSEQNIASYFTTPNTFRKILEYTKDELNLKEDQEFTKSGVASQNGRH